MQPIVLGLLILFYKKKVEKYSKLTLLIYIVVAGLYTINIYNKINYTTAENITLCENNQRPSLKWEWNNQPYRGIVYFLFVVTLCVLWWNNFSQPMNIVLVLFTLITFFMTHFNYKISVVGRFWCYFASFTPLILLIFKDKISNRTNEI